MSRKFNVLPFALFTLFSEKIKKTIKNPQRLISKTIFSFPFLSQYNPRKKITTFNEWGKGKEIESFPNLDESLSKNWYLTIRKPEIILRTDPINFKFEAKYQDFQKAMFYRGGYRYETPPVFLSCLSNAKILSTDCIVLSPENHIFFDSIWSYYPSFESNKMLDGLRLPKSRYYSGEYYLLGMIWADNYYHWLLEILPRLSLMEEFDQLKKLPIILNRDLKQFQKDTLRLAGISMDQIVRFDGSFWQVERLYYPSPLSGPGNPSPHSVSWLRKKFLEKLEPSGACEATSYLYVTRRDAGQRRILNEDEIISFLETKGFKVICPGEMTFLEQVEAFRRAKLVVAPHGAGLSNMVFAPSGSSLIELFPDTFANACYWSLANVCGQNYSCLVGNSVNRYKDFYLSLQDLKEMLGILNQVSNA